MISIINSHSPDCLPYISYDVNSQNLVLDQLIILIEIFFFILITCLLDIVLGNELTKYCGSLFFFFFFAAILKIFFPTMNRCTVNKFSSCLSANKASVPWHMYTY